MSTTLSIVQNRSAIHKAAVVPVFKVEGFDGYDFAALGVTDQFLEGSSVYFEKYTNPAHFKELYRVALDSIRLDGQSLQVLDIGTGGGNSIFALFELLDPRRISAIGVDISPQLLEMCSDAGHRIYGLDERQLVLLCADLYALKVKEESVDLVTGSSILHHMIDPAQIVRNTLSALKRGGSAIFTEPFEDGNGMLVNAYSNILAFEQHQALKLPDDLRTFMTEMRADFDARKGIGKLRDYTRFLDDKWYFTRSWFNDFAIEAGCRLQVIPTHGGGSQIFWHHFLTTAKIHNGADGNSLPEWAKQIVHRIDDTFSEAQKKDALFTGIVILTKAK